MYTYGEHWKFNDAFVDVIPLNWGAFTNQEDVEEFALIQQVNQYDGGLCVKYGQTFLSDREYAE